MNNSNKHSQPFIMVMVITIVLFVVTKLGTQFTVWGFKTKKVDMFSDIVKKNEVKKKLTSLLATDSIPLIKDIVLLPIGSDNIFDFKTDTSSSLSHFFQALNATNTHTHKTRIAYFGDSMIEGDLISQDLRNSMQEKFGGFGVGFVPITSIVAGFRASITHSFDGWTTYNLIEKTPANHVLGISGYGFVPDTLNYLDSNNTSNKGSWVNYAAVPRKHLDKFCGIKLLYGKSSGDNYMEVNDVIYPLTGTNSVNQLEIKTEINCKSIKAEFYCKRPIDIFGFSIESDSGVFVDNFSFRGNSGMPITKVPQRIYSGTNDCLGYDLIILEYGLNAVSPTITDYGWYEQGMNNVIQHIHSSFPQASILLISVGDKSYRNNGIYETDPSVPLLVETQKRMAKTNKVAFWSLYDAMGGYGSMVKWVEGDTAFANKDYTHFNFRGAHKVGKLLFSKLMNEYDDYNEKHQ